MQINKVRFESRQAILAVKRTHLASLSPERSIELDNFIIEFGGSPFHEIPFNKLAAEYFKSNAVICIAETLDSQLAGICIIHYFGNGLLKEGFSGLCNHEIPYGGWIYNPDLVNISDLIPLTCKSWMEKIYYYSNVCYDNEPYYMNNGFHSKKTVIVDLHADLLDYFENTINSHTRNKIRKALKSGVVTKWLGPDELESFRIISAELKDRVGLPNEYGFYKQVFEQYYPLSKAACIAEVYDNEVVSAGIMLANTNVSVGWVAARKTEIPNNLYQNELLFWDSIKWSKEQGCRYFDLSGLEEEKLPHLARIKLSISQDYRYFYSKTLQSFPARVISRIQNF